jgi:hypothetical protein
VLDNDKIDTAAINEAIRQWIKNLGSGKVAIDPVAITATIRQWIKDLNAEMEWLKAAREAMPPKRPSDARRSKRG